MSPYIITTRQAADLSRRAVATLDEAKDAVFVVVTDATMENTYDLDRIVGERGGTIGPLPDGTLITVEQVGFHALREAIGWGSVHPMYHEAILTAYNAAQN